MPVGGTTIGPVDPEVRDRLAKYRDREGFRNYNEAIETLLSQENA